MNINIQNSMILFVLISLLVLGCSSSGSPPNYGVERGRLKYDSGFYVNGKLWLPKDDPKLSSRINWCDTSPNPKVEVLRCFSDSSENYAFTYLIRMKGDEPELQKIDEPLGSIWVNDEGKWLLGKKILINVETGEQKPVKGMPWADRTDSSAPVQYIIAVSPDMKTAVRTYRESLPSKKGEDDFRVLQLIDLETGNLENRKVNLTKYSWLKDYEQPHDDFLPPPAPGKKFVWEKGEDGRDKVKVPELLEKFVEVKEKQNDK